MLVKKYGIPKETAPILFGLPYIISACSSPFLGFMIDRVGKRVHIGN
jgi:Na+/melibiose symporter-like transporter